MSNTIFDAWLPAHLATLQQRVQPAQGPLGYGVDIAMTVSEDGHLDIDPLRRQVDPESVAGIYQSLVRRLSTPAGRLRMHKRYGFDVLSLLNRAVTPTLLQTVPQQIERECRKDQRVSTAKCTATSTGSGQLTLEIEVQPRSSRESFSLVFTVGDGRLTAALIGS